jgi:hypothetical protein
MPHPDSRPVAQTEPLRLACVGRPGGDRSASHLSGRRLTGASGANQKGVARLEDYSFGWLTVDGQEHTRDLMVLPTGS